MDHPPPSRKDPLDYKRLEENIISDKNEILERHDSINQAAAKHIKVLDSHDVKTYICDADDCLLAVDSDHPVRANRLCHVCKLHGRCARCRWRDDREENDYRLQYCGLCKRTAHVTCGHQESSDLKFLCNGCITPVPAKIPKRSPSAVERADSSAVNRR